MPTFIIIPAHNRKPYTLSCLQNLQTIGVMELFRIVVIDDGSSDGTAESISTQFPEVILLQGDGSLYWTGAIEMGMRYAMEQDAECMVWLNDDSMVAPLSIERLVKIANATDGIACPKTFVKMHTIGSNYYFPGKHKGNNGIIDKAIPSGVAIVAVDACRGNLVAISRKVVEAIGYPDGKNLPHALGDADYTLRATEAGMACSLVTNVLLEELGTIRTDNDSWLLGETPISELWSAILKKKGILFPPARWVYLTRHWRGQGMLQFPIPYIKLALVSVLRMFIPRSLLISLFGKYSHAWVANSWIRNGDD